MSRNQTIDKINATLERLPDERLETLAEIAESWTQPTVYSSLGDDERAEIEAGLNELDRGDGVAWPAVKSALDAKLKTAGV